MRLKASAAVSIVSSASTGWGSLTRSTVRWAGSIVVAQRYCAGISPRPLKRLISTLPRPLKTVAQQFLAVRVVAGVLRHVALGQAVERRQREEEVAVVDELRHLAEEEGHQERGDVRAVDIGVGHDDDALVAQRLLACNARRRRRRAPG